MTLALGALAAALPAASAAAPRDIDGTDAQAYAPGQVVVGYEPGTTKGERRDVRRDADAKLRETLSVPRAEVLKIDTSDSVKTTAAELTSLPEVAYAEPNYVYDVSSTTPDDTLFPLLQWPLDNQQQSGGIADADIDAPEAWDATTGSDQIVVAVVDSGVNMGHPDLDDNIWLNQAEDAGTPGLDDDEGPGNGYVDDLHGWDFVSPEDNDPNDEEGHGTHVAGILGAEGNNGIGIAGVNWDVSMMPLRACGPTGSCFSADVAEAFQYAGENGADVVNASISGTGQSLVQASAIAAAPDTMFVFAAGNEANDDDLSPRFPCNYPGENVVCVAASTTSDTLAGYSNYGFESVDIAAPGGGTSFGQTDGDPIISTYALTDKASQKFESPLSGQWSSGGVNNTWDRTTEASGLTSGTLTDSPGAGYLPNTHSFARLGPINLSGDMACSLRYDLQMDVPDPDDHLVVETSSDPNTGYMTIQDWTGSGTASLTPDISGVSGSATAYVRFRLITDGAVEGDGAHLDNVRIRCPSDSYAYLQGTSMAAPHVSGAVALMLAETPSATIPQLREWLLDGVDTIPELQTRVGSGGRLNLARSVAGADGADIRRPQTTINAGPPINSRATAANFGFSADEPSTFQCSLNGVAFTSCTSPRQLGGLAIGTHSFRVRAVDGSGNIDATPAAYSFTVQAPTVSAACTKARAKLRKARTVKQKRKWRRQVKRNCART